MYQFLKVEIVQSTYKQASPPIHKKMGGNKTEKIEAVVPDVLGKKSGTSKPGGYHCTSFYLLCVHSFAKTLCVSFVLVGNLLGIALLFHD